MSTNLAATHPNTRAFTAKQLSRMVQLYLDGVGIAALALKFDASFATIRKNLVANGVTIRPRGRPSLSGS